jgi:hypothetical protein
MDGAGKGRPSARRQCRGSQHDDIERNNYLQKVDIVDRDIASNKSRFSGTGSAGVLRPNHLFPPWTSRRVRRALLGAINQTEFMMAVGNSDHSEVGRVR